MIHSNTCNKHLAKLIETNLSYEYALFLKKKKKKKKKWSVLEGWEKWNLVNKYQIYFVRDKKNGILLIKIRYVL